MVEAPVLTPPPARILAAPPSSEEPYAIYHRGSGWEMAVEPMPVQFEGFESHDLFVHRIAGGYRVSERLTGLAVVSQPEVNGERSATFLTPGEAIGAAAAKLGAIGPDKFSSTIIRVLVSRGNAERRAAAGGTQHG